MDMPPWSPFSQPYSDDPIDQPQHQPLFQPWAEPNPAPVYRFPSRQSPCGIIDWGQADMLMDNGATLMLTGSQDVLDFSCSLGNAHSNLLSHLADPRNLDCFNTMSESFVLDPFNAMATNNVLGVAASSFEGINAVDLGTMINGRGHRDNLMARVAEYQSRVSISADDQEKDTMQAAAFSTDKGRAESSHQGSLACEHPGCMVKFTRKKDRTRHFRQKHQANEGYRCPLLDCFMGTGHKIQRKDKLREHLRRKNDPSSPWKCFLPACSEVAIGKTGLMNHLGTHERMLRLSNQQLIIDYGSIHGELYPGIHYDKPPLGYLTCEYVCLIQSCPFGTNSSEVMKRHAATPHQGPNCPCPMPNCDQIFKDWSATSAHLAHNHDATQRKIHDKELLDQGFWWRSSIFVCPICKVEIKILLNKVSCDEKIRAHCKMHSVQELKALSSELVQAFVLSNRRKLWYPRMPLLDANDEQVFAYLTWPKEDLLKIWTL